MCYIFGQIFPFHSELREDKIATWLRLPPAVFLSPPTFWEACDQPEPWSFFPRMNDPGNEVGIVSGTRKFDHVTPILKQLQWLPIIKQIAVRDATMVFECLSAQLQHKEQGPPTYTTL